MDENWGVRDDLRDGNEGFEDSRRRRPEEP